MDIVSYVLSRKYTEDTVIGLGAIKGAPCTIKKTEHKDGVTYITFEWTATDGTTKQQTTVAISDGTPIYDYTVGDTYHYGDLVIYEAQFYRCIQDCVAGPVLDELYFNALNAPDANYDIVQNSSMLPARFLPSDRKMYYSIDDCAFWLWDGTQWVLQERPISNDEIDNLFN
jgi:hypothetical protein